MGKGETLNSWEVKQLEAGFNVLDLNKDGKIEFGELKIALSACGFDYNEEEIADMIRVVDKNRNPNGCVTKAQFKRLFSHQHPDQVQEEIEEAFKHLTNGEDELTKERLKEIFTSIEVEFTEEEINELIELADFLGHEISAITIEEFQLMCNEVEPTKD